MDALAQQIEVLIPKGLDDVIRLNQDKVALRLATEIEIMKLHASITPAQEKSTFDDWRFICLVDQLYGDYALNLLGNTRNGHAKVTSSVLHVDLDRGLVRTSSGSLYRLGQPGQGEPPFEHLTMLCAAFHIWGRGEYLGVPRFFY